MKKSAYKLVKIWIKIALHLYYGKIKVSGLENVPKDKPVLFLPNHQNALLDVLLIAVDCNRKPYFLTRSDVFKNNFLNAIFDFFRMIPIYRIRDGRESLKNNQAVFDRCSELLHNKHAILMFPEANHNLRRRVRPLSKGFTRILFNTLEKSSDLDIRLVPVGLNYKRATLFPDQVALYYGEDIAVGNLYDVGDLQSSIHRIKGKVSASLKKLTTHIEDEESYDKIEAKLNALDLDYLNPYEVNAALLKMGIGTERVKKDVGPGIFSQIFKSLFVMVNFPIILLWHFWLKPKVWEPEFTDTLRFAFALLAYPMYYVILFVLLLFLMSPVIAFLAVGGLFVFNWAYTRLN